MASDGAPSKKHELSFRPRARLVSVLGEQLIGDQAVGLIELVKNAYDADATEVEIQLLGLAKAETTCILVRDNGCGMTLEDVRDKWLSPAVSHKDQAKQEQRRTARNRIPIGEKGVGRFAVHQLGKKLELTTRARNAREVFVPVDWDRFDARDAFLDNLSITIDERDPKLFEGKKTGTLMKVEGARSIWTRQLLEKVHRTLRRLQSPIQDKDPEFQVTLKCPEYPEYEKIDPTDILERSHYEFQALIEESGECDFEYVCRHPSLSKRNKSGTIDLVPLAAKELQGAKPQCGPFWVNLYVWDRTKDSLTQAGVSAKELNALSGVSVFRDGLRVLPYGEPGDDWLLLDQERIQDPSGKIGNNQVVGLVQVLQERNLRLRDKTNREGLIENEAFLDLKAMVRAAIRFFTTHWKKDRPKEVETAVRKHEGTLGTAKGIASALKDSVSDSVKVTIPSTGDSSPGTPDTPQSRVVTQREAVDALITNIEGAEQSAKDRERKLERFRSLAATGLAAERVVHEFGRQVSAALTALAELRRSAKRDAGLRASLEALESCLGTLRNEFRILAPFEAIDRGQKSREMSLREAIDLALTLNRKYLDEGEIDVAVEGKDFAVLARPSSLVQVFDNLIHNSCYWLATSRQKSARKICALFEPKERRVILADSGPGIHDEARAHLFQPFFSMKAGGTGLGLYITSELLKAMGATIAVADREASDGLPAWAKGAAFGVTFSPLPGKGRS